MPGSLRHPIAVVSRSDIYESEPLPPEPLLRRLPVHVEPQPGEALCSWAMRLSAKIGVPPLLLGKWAFGINANTDRHWWRRPSDEMLAAISDRTGLSIDRLRSMTLLDYAVAGQDEVYDRFRARRNRRAGDMTRTNRPIVTCLHCLAEDDAPFIRLEWMIGWICVCLRHGTEMTTCCPHCTAIICMPNLASRDVAIIGCCAHCGASLACRSSVGAARPMVMRIQAEMLSAKRKGRGPIASLPPMTWATMVVLIDLILFTIWSVAPDYRREHLFKRVATDIGMGVDDHLRIDWTDNIGTVLLLEWLAGGWSSRFVDAMAMLQTPRLEQTIDSLVDMAPDTRAELLAILPKGMFDYRPGTPPWRLWLETLPSSEELERMAWRQLHSQYERRIHILALLREKPDIDYVARVHGLKPRTVQRMVDYAADYGLEVILRRAKHVQYIKPDERRMVEDWLRTVRRPVNAHGWSATHAQWEIAVRFGLQLSVAACHEMLMRTHVRNRPRGSFKSGPSAPESGNYQPVRNLPT
jgi:hypothetical protein